MIRKWQNTKNQVVSHIFPFSSKNFYFIPSTKTTLHTSNSTFHTPSYLFVKLHCCYWLTFHFGFVTEQFIQSPHTTSPFSAQHRPRVRPVDFNFILKFSFNVPYIYTYIHTHHLPVATVECALHCHSIKPKKKCTILYVNEKTRENVRGETRSDTKLNWRKKKVKLKSNLKTKCNKMFFRWYSFLL